MSGVLMEKEPSDVGGDLANLLAQVEALAKNPAFGLSLGSRGINQALLLVAVQGLRAYVEGNKLDAAQDFETVAEEIRARAAQTD